MYNREVMSIHLDSSYPKLLERFPLNLVLSRRGGALKKVM
jgi:hypothetical protein